MRRLTAAQVRALRAIVEGAVRRMEEKRGDAHHKGDSAAVAWYNDRIRETEALLAALPERGGVELEEDPENNEDEE